MKQRTRNVLTVTLSLGSLVVVAVLLAALTSGPRLSDPYRRRPSTMFTDRSGARACLLVAQKLLPSAGQWRAPFTELAGAGASDPGSSGPRRPAGSLATATLVVAGPQRPIQAAEADALDRWVRGGGQLILTIDRDWEIEEGDSGETGGGGYLDRHAIDVQGTDERIRVQSNVHDREPPEKVYQQVPVERFGPQKLSLRIGRSASVTGDAEPLAMIGDDVLIAELALGRGRIIIIPDAAFLSNDSLVRSDNAAVLIGFCAGWGGGGVLFDEFHHGFGRKRGLAALSWQFAGTPWGWAVLTVAAAGAIYVFGFRRRFGRPIEPRQPDRASPLDLVDARAGLFRAAGSSALAVNVICMNLTHELGRALGRPVDLAELYRHHQHSNRPPACLEQIGRLAQLFLRVRTEGRADSNEVSEAGWLAGRILEEMSVER